MSTLFVNEYRDMPNVNGTGYPVAQEPRLATNNVTYTGTPGVSAAFNTNTRFIAVTSDGIFSYLVSTAGTSAAITDFRIPAGIIIYLGVKAGDKISAITNT